MIEILKVVLTPADVEELEFVRVEDELQHNWGIWEVNFVYKDKKCVGYLQAGIPEPEGFHDDKIEDIEIL